MTNRKDQIGKWAYENIKKWPAPFETNPDGPDPIDIGCEWVCDETLSVLPLLRCRLGGCHKFDSTDWFYTRIKYRSSGNKS